MTLLLVYLFTALIISFLCSILEAVLLSTPLSWLKAKAEAGHLAAIRMIKLKEDIDRPLSAILSLNTVAHTVGAAGVGAQATMVFGEAYFGLVSAILTMLILVLTEIVPKTLGANYSKELVAPASAVIRGMIVLTYPLVVVSAYLTRVLGKNDSGGSTSREEISALATLGVEEGVFADKENRIIQNLLRLKHIRVSEIMTPRVVVATAREDMTLQEFLGNKDFLHFSRIPIYRDTPDSITGYVFRESVFEKLAEDQFQLCLRDIVRPIVTLTESTTVFAAWDILLHAKEHIALVADEYGGMAGVASLEDIIETLLGFEILDEKDRVEDMQKYAMERWKARRLKYRMLLDDSMLGDESAPRDE